MGQAKLVIEASVTDVCTIVAGGITLHEAIKAANQLKVKGINVRVIDVFCVKPLDWQTILENAKETKNRVLTVEDHYVSGNKNNYDYSCVTNGSRSELKNIRSVVFILFFEKFVF